MNKDNSSKVVLKHLQACLNHQTQGAVTQISSVRGQSMSNHLVEQVWQDEWIMLRNLSMSRIELGLKNKKKTRSILFLTKSVNNSAINKDFKCILRNLKKKNLRNSNSN